MPVSSGPTEVLLEALRKTRVVIRKNDPKSPPIFDDYLYTNVRPLKLVGKAGERFFIEARDPDAVQITKNGSPIAYQAPGITIQ